MRKLSIKVALVASLVGVASFSTPSRAESGQGGGGQAFAPALLGTILTMGSRHRAPEGL